MLALASELNTVRPIDYAILPFVMLAAGVATIIILEGFKSVVVKLFEFLSEEES